MTEKVNASDVKDFLEALGLDEEPMGMYYTDVEPEEGISPKSSLLPTIEMEARGEVDWAALFGDFSCVIGNIWHARKKKTAAYQGAFWLPRRCLLPGISQTSVELHYPLCFNRH